MINRIGTYDLRLAQTELEVCVLGQRVSSLIPKEADGPQLLP
jgi:hypothetical protein